MPEWRIYYDDGSTFDSSQGDRPPPRGVVTIAQRAKLRIQTRWDWYWEDLRDGVWYGADVHGLLDLLLDCRDRVGRVLMGRTVPCEAYDRILTAASSDEDFPQTDQQPRTRAPAHSHD